MKRSSFSKSIAVLIASALFAGSVVRLGATPNRSSEDLINQPATARATVSPHGALVEWVAEFDNRILGFNVFRITGAQRVKLNPDLIAGPTMVSAARRPSFAWFDPAVVSDSTYEVEAIDLRGEILTRTIAMSVAAGFLPSYRQAPLLTELGAGKATQISKAQWQDSKDPVSSEVVASDTSSSLTQQWSIAGQPALKIGIRADGWYRITQGQLSAAGFDVTRDARNLQLFVEGNEIAMSVSRDTGVLSQADFVEFWGQGLDSPTTDTRVYWLVNGPQAGKRIGVSGNLRPDTEQPNRGVVSDSARAVTPSLTHLSSGSWPIAATSPVSANRAKPDEAVSVVEAISTAVLSSTEPGTIEPVPTKDGAAKFVSEPALSKDPVPQPVTSSSPDTTPARTSLSAKHARSPKRRSAKKRSRNHRRTSRRRLHNHAIDVASSSPAFVCSIDYSLHNIYYTAALNGDHENFFGPVVSGNGASVTLATRNIERTSTAPVQLTASLQGATLGTHQINVLVNDTLAGSITFSDQSATSQTLSFPGAWLIDGNNAIKLVPASANDTSLVDDIRLTYAHSFRAENDSLQFTLKATQSARVDGFTSADIRVVDVTDPGAVQIIRPAIDGGGNAFAATVPAGDRGKARRLIALPASRISQPTSLTLNQPSTLNSNANTADLVIIAYKDFIPSLAPLVAQRQAQGYSVKVADIEDVYDEFSFGEHTSQAIRDFMLLAKNSWMHGPSYLLLVGDASYDPRNRLGFGSFDLVPTKLVDTGTAGTASALEAASDDALIDFDGDGIADIAVGRLPVRTVADANLVVGKIVNYSPGNTGNKALLVADTQGSYFFNFEAANDQVATTLPAGMTIQKVYRRLQPSDAIARTNIITNLNSGQSVTVYSGHGNVDIWGGSIFTGSDAAALTNGNRLSFVVVMDCLNGYFDDPALVSLGETFLAAPNGGAVASFASSGLTLPDGQHAMGFKMFQLLYSGSPMPVGDASRQAKSATSDMDVRRTWVLFGDPTLKIR